MNEAEVKVIYNKIKDIKGPRRVDKLFLQNFNSDALFNDLNLSDHFLVFFNLILLTDEISVKNGELERYIAAIKPHGDLKKFIMLSFLSSFTVLPRTVVTKLSVMASIEGDGNARRWITCALDLISEGKNSDDLRWPLEFYSLSRGSIIIRGRTIGIPLFSHHKGLRVIRNASQNAIDEILACRSKANIKKKSPSNLTNTVLNKLKSALPFTRTQTPKILLTGNKRKTVIFIGSRAFPGEANTHFNYLANSASAFNFGNENVSVKLALSPEDVLISPWANFGLYDDHKMRFHQRKWEKLNSENNAVFPASAIKPEQFDKHQYMTEMFDWIDEQEPDLVVFLSGVYESYVARGLAYVKYKTVILPTSVNHMPTSFYDYVISTSEIYNQRLLEHKVESRAILSVPVVVNIFQDTAPYSQNFRRTENEFLLTTVIGGGRLLKSFNLLSRDEILKIEALFESCPNLTWLLVGEPNFSEIICLSEKFGKLEQSGRIVGIEHIKEIRSFFQSVDLVFNLPDEAGGGQGVAAAIFEGASALIPTKSDSASYVPQEGQYIELVEGINRIIELANNPQSKKEFNELCSERLKEHFIENVSVHWQRELGLIVA